LFEAIMAPMTPHSNHKMKKNSMAIFSRWE
jgi:hypothetical protein